MAEPMESISQSDIAAVRTPPARTLHTTASLAAELGTSERTIRRAIEAGELPATRRAGRWVMTTEDVCQWARSGLQPTRGCRRRNDLPRARARASDGLAGVFAAQEVDAA